MRGGKIVGSTSACALRKVGIALLAVPLTWVGDATTFDASAHPNHAHSDAHLGYDDQCAPEPTREQSILISAKKLIDQAESKPAESSEKTELVLEPIAKSSERVPELAEPPTLAQVPTLAEPITNLPGTTEPPVTPLTKNSELSEPRIEKAPKVELAVTAEAEAICFNGITPGDSTRIDVLRGWGDPRSEDTQAEELRYRFDDLPAVVVRFAKNRVESILVELDRPTKIATLTRKLELESLRPATLTDANGTAIAQVYPERGVVLGYAAKELGLSFASDDNDHAAAQSPRIDNILIQPLQAAPFMLRAEANQQINFTYAIADLEAALRVDEQMSAAHIQLADLQLEIGKPESAERHAAQAVELEPLKVAYRLQWAKCLRNLARYDQAVEQVQEVLETPGISPLARAQALHEMGLLTSLGSQKVARRAVPLHTKAIKIADGLTVSDDPEVWRPAKELLVEAHLAVAVEISSGDWQQKDESVAQWIERASALAEALISEDPAFLPMRLQVAVSSLDAAANLEEPINPLLWIEEAEETVGELKAEILDPLTTSQYDWQLGLAYFHGAQIEHRRSEPDSAIHLGELAEQQLSELATQYLEKPDTDFLRGRLYFQIGAVHAVHYKDHATACHWYDQAVELLLEPVAVTPLASPQQHGDALVSMGVSYWNESEAELAIEVTEAGVELIEQAVESELLGPSALKIAYGNLSAMHHAQGEDEPAARYERLAKKLGGTTLSKN